MTKEICDKCLLYKNLNEYCKCNICEEKKEILIRLHDKRVEVTKQIKMIENLKIEPVKEYKWHELCKTPVRYTDIILEIAKVTFPYGENFTKKNPNEIAFEINGFNITIPTTDVKGIVIDMKWCKPYMLQDFKPQNQYKNMRKYFELIEKGNHNWYELAKCRCNMNLTRKQLFRWWFLKGKWHIVDKNFWKEKIQLEDKKNNENYIKHKENQEALKLKIKEFHKVVDILKEWAEVKGCIYQDGVYKTCNIENYLR